MKTGIKLAAVTSAVLLVAGCSSAQTAEQACKSYLSEFDHYLSEILQGNMSAATNFGNRLNSLAEKAPAEIASAMRADAINPTNSYQTSAACAGYIK